MAEYVNFSAESDDDDEDELEKKSSSKSEKKASIFGASALKTSENATNKEQPKKAEGLDKLLAELSFSKKAEAPKTADENPTLEVAAEPAQEIILQPNDGSPESVPEPSDETPEDAIETSEDIADTVELESSSADLGEEDATVVSGSMFTRSSSAVSSTPPSMPSLTPTASTLPSPTSAGSASVPHSPTPPAERAAMYAASTTSAAEVSNVASNSTETIGKKDVEAAADDAWYYGRQKGRQEGVLAGALLGGGVEHFRHKRRERKMEKEFGKKEKTHEKELKNLTYEQQREAMVKDLREAYEQRYQNKPEAAVATAGPETAGGSVQSTKTEQSKSITPEEVIEVPQDHHIERSAWLSVEVDEHGNPVENNSFEYGAEYYRERAHEIRAEDDNDDESTAKQDKALNQPDQKVQQSSPAMFAGSPLTATPPASVAPQLPPKTTSTVSAPKRVVHAVTSPPTTPAGTAAWSVALVVILGIVLVVML